MHDACQESGPVGLGGGCVDFTADSEPVALTKCALIAGTKNWLGGHCKPGSCAAS